MVSFAKPRGVICFTNPQQLEFIKKNGVYGNVDTGDTTTKTSGQAISKAKQIRFGKIADLLSVIPGDIVFLFERDASKLHGVWKITSQPFFSTKPIFDPNNAYPYRFNIEVYLDFPSPIPVMELRKLLNQNLIWSIRTFERESQATFASINPISIEETEAITDVFYRYNHRINPHQNPVAYHKNPLKEQVNYHDLVMNDIHTAIDNLEIEAINLGKTPKPVILEEALHAFLTYNLVRSTPEMRRMFGEYRQVLREVPISVAGQHRVDLLLIYENEITHTPTVYSLVEVKRDAVTIDRLRQLLEYIKLFSERHHIDSNSVEGIYIGRSFEEDAEGYIKNRAKIESERPVRLINYKIDGNSILLTNKL